jgi:ABC-2 type transport system ATP-binding protein
MPLMFFFSDCRNFLIGNVRTDSSSRSWQRKMTGLADEARKEADKISLELQSYRLDEAIQRTLDFPLSFFVQGSLTYQSFRDATVSLSERYNRVHDPAESPSEKARDAAEDEIIRELNKLVYRMASAAQQSADLTSEAPRPSRLSKPIVVLSDCCKEFDRFHLGPINFSIDEGDVLALMGPNASGKSTLLRLILGEIAASKGAVIYKGLPRSLTFRGNRSNIGYVPQFTPPWKGSLRQNLHYYLSIRGVHGSENEKKVEYYLHRFRLTPYQDHTWSGISGGYRLRAALARELLMEPHLLILDEPLAHLDAESQFVLLDIIKSISNRFQQPVTVVLTSQHIYETERFATKAIVLGGDGRALAQGALSELNKHKHKAIYELEMDVPIDALRRALDDMQCEIRGRPPVFIVEFSKQQAIESIVDRLSIRGLSLKAMRDISESSRPHFRNIDQSI